MLATLGRIHPSFQSRYHRDLDHQARRHGHHQDRLLLKMQSRRQGLASKKMGSLSCPWIIKIKYRQARRQDHRQDHRRARRQDHHQDQLLLKMQMWCQWPA